MSIVTCLTLLTEVTSGGNLASLPGQCPDGGWVWALPTILIYGVLSISETFPDTGYIIANTSKLRLCKYPFELFRQRLLFLHPVSRIVNLESRSISTKGVLKFKIQVFLERGIIFRANSS